MCQMNSLISTLHLFPVCFKIFDHDKDGILNKSEVLTMVQSMIEVHNQTLNEHDRQFPDAEKMAEDILEGKEALTIEDYLIWTATSKDLPGSFAKMIFQLCHIVLGLQPPSRQVEGEIVRGWLDREEKAPLSPGQTWYLLNIDWWHHWNCYVSLNDSIIKKSAPGSPAVEIVREINGGYNQISETLRPPSTSTLSSEEATMTPVHSPHVSRKNSVQQGQKPGLIDNSNLIITPSHKVTSLTGRYTYKMQI